MCTSKTSHHPLQTQKAEAPAESLGSGHSVASVNISNSSTESCKNSVGPLTNDVIITIEDDVETKLELDPSS